MHALLTILIAILAGAIASITGFGIGSILTPWFAAELGTKLAVAAVALPHFAATLFRFIKLRHHLDRKVLWSFGIMSAVGGLIGALLHNSFSSPAITIIFGSLLVISGIMGLTGIAQRMRLHGVVAYADGALSGLFGGLAGNQGGIRTAGLMAFDMTKASFVATATAIGVIVDVVRMPVYLATEAQDLTGSLTVIAIATAGTLIGTLFGNVLLDKIPEASFKRVVSLLVLALGIYILLQG